ncbi:MAG: hypothetical protein NTX28_06760, partial [Novosphingobium sp.]|nr:hypothetical protein [Novosphingobium sp.]
MAQCKHCGELVEMDRARQWRRMPIGLFSYTDAKPFERQIGRLDAEAIPLSATETAAELIEFDEVST